VRAFGVKGELLQPFTASMSSKYDGQIYGPAKCIDGDTKTPSILFSGGNMCVTRGDPSPWLAIDYGVTVTVSRVEIFNREDCCGARTRKVDVRVSNELPTSASAMFSGGSLLGHFAGPGTDGQHIIITGQAMSGRYVIVQIDNGEGLPLSLREVRAFGVKGELLQPFTASMSSKYDGQIYGPAKCIDGDTKTPSILFSGGNMCVTRGDPSPWLAIDYGVTVTVSRVEIFNREDCCGARTRKVDVRVSNELPTSASAMFSGGSLLGHFAGPGRNGEHIIVTGQAFSGRYVIVQMDTGESINLKEVRAFGMKDLGSVHMTAATTTTTAGEDLTNTQTNSPISEENTTSTNPGVVEIDERIYWVLVSIPILFFLVGVFFLCWNQSGLLKPCCCVCCGLCEKMEKEDLNPNYGTDLDEASYVMEARDENPEYDIGDASHETSGKHSPLTQATDQNPDYEPSYDSMENDQQGTRASLNNAEYDSMEY